MKKKTFIYMIFVLSLCALFAFTGCNSKNGNNNGDKGDNSENVRTYWSVGFDSLGGNVVESQQVFDGNPIRTPDKPVREAYYFIGWYLSSEDNAELWNFATDRVHSDLTLYAKWKEISTAESPTESLTYEKNGNGYTVTGYDGQEERIVIPSEYDGLPVTEIGESAFSYSNHTSTITYVSVPDTVTVIGQNAFYGCSELVTVNIGENSRLISIGRNAFSGNGSLKNIYIAQGVESIGEGAFNNCGGLEEFTVASANATFRSENGHLIEKATDTLIRGVNHGIIPDGVKAIAQAAFRRSTLERIEIPASVTQIGNYAFDDIPALKEISVNGDNTNYASIGGIVYNKATTRIEIVPEGLSGNVVLAETLTDIPCMTFDGMTNITAIRIYGSVTSIGLGAFRGLTAAIHYTGTEDEWNRISKNSSWNMGAILNIRFSSDGYLEA